MFSIYQTLQYKTEMTKQVLKLMSFLKAGSKPMKDFDYGPSNDWEFNLFVLLFNMPVNAYGHVGTSPPLSWDVIYPTCRNNDISC